MAGSRSWNRTVSRIYPSCLLALSSTLDVARASLTSSPIGNIARRNSSASSGQVYHETSNSTNTTLSSSLKVPQITRSPLYAYDLPSGTSENASTILCALGDSQCSSICASTWQVCSASWAYWSSSSVSFSTAFGQKTFPFTIYSTSHLQSTSTYERGDYIYELGPGLATFTSTYYDERTTGNPELSVVTTYGEPPSCTWQPCSIVPTSTAASCQKSCEVQGGTVELIYWADMAMSTSSKPAQASASVMTIPGYQNRSTSEMRTVTALYKNMTLTSPTVYIDFQTAYATDNCGNGVGKRYPGAIIGVDPHSLYSMQGQYDYMLETMDDGERTSTFYPSATFDFHDLNGQPPVSAYIAQPSCIAYGCYTIWSSLYRPVLVLPSQVRNLDPAWKSCGLDWHGAWDPPIALQPAQVIDPVTTPHAPSYTVPASPHSTISAPASQTSTAGTNDPDTTTSQDASTLSSTASTSLSEPGVSLQSSTSSVASSSFADPSGLDPSWTWSQIVPEIPTSFSYQPVQSAEEPSNTETAGLTRPGTTSALPSSLHATQTSSATNAYEVLTAAQGSTSSSLVASTDYPADPRTSIDPGLPSQAVPTTLLSTDPLAITTTSGQALNPVPIASSDGASANLFSLAGTTLSEGGPALSTAGHSYSIMSGSIFQDGGLLSFPTVGSSLVSTPQAVLTIGTTSVTAQAGPGSAVILGSQTLLPGSEVALESHTLSVVSNGIVQDGTTMTFSVSPSTTSIQKSEVILPLPSSIGTASQVPGSYIAWAIGSQTLSAGGSAVTANGHSISVASSGALLVDGTTAPLMSDPSLPSVQMSSSLSTFLPVITTASGARSPGQDSAAPSTAVANSSATVSSAGSVAGENRIRTLAFVPAMVAVYYLYGLGS